MLLLRTSYMSTMFVCLHTYSWFIFRICEIAYLIKYTGDQKINAHGTSMVIQGHAKGGENMSHPAHFPLM